MRIVDVTPTCRLVGPDDGLLQIVRVTVAGRGRRHLEVVGPGVTTPDPVEVLRDTDEEFRVEVAVEVDAPVGARLPIRAVLVAVEAAAQPVDVGDDQRAGELTVAGPGWRMFLVPHFHYDPVWWNTQAFYTETWEKLPRDQRPWEGRRQQPAFTLIDAHLDAARRDPGYLFVLAELDYLKPYWDTFPEVRDEFRQLLADGRLELMGGTYNEPNTNLTSAETTVRNAVYGIAYQREVLGGDPATAWQLDVFGHDPQFPGMMAEAGLTSSSWARGPFHQWGPSRSPGGNAAMEFATEFDWLSPSGRGLLTSYMANHYSAGWELDHAADLEEALDEAERLFTELKVVAATHNVLLPVGSDYTPPNRWVTSVAREWSARYTWPRFEVALPRTFFAAVREELAVRGPASPQTRDMNPIYSGKDVSYIDTKQAQRVGEHTLLAAERFGTVAAILGARYAHPALDKAWRQLLFGAHHDGITGTESDQVYLDLLGGWRDTYELATDALTGALDHLASQVQRPADGDPFVVFNALGWARSDVVRVEVDLGGIPGLRLLDDGDRDVAFVLESVDRDGDGALTSATLTFVATDVPSCGYRTYRWVPADRLPAGATWEPFPGHRIEGGRYAVGFDAGRGGAISALVDRHDGTSFLRTGELANEVLAYTEYPEHPSHGEGPWHLTPTGEVASSADRPAHRVEVESSALGQRGITIAEVAGCTLTQTTELLDGIDRVGCVTRLDGFAGQDVLFRLRVAADVPAGLPVSEVAAATIGRSPGFPDVDVAEVASTLDNPAFTWCAVSSTARVELVGDTGEVAGSRAIGVAEVVAPDALAGAVPVDARPADADGGHQISPPDGDTASGTEAVRDLVVALVRAGVTSTVSRGSGPRYGAIDTDSNLPDMRIALGGPDDNPFTAQVLDAADDAYRAELTDQLAADGRAVLWVPAVRPLAEVWRPNADLRGARDLPVLIVAGTDPAALHAVLTGVAAQLAETAVVQVRQPSTLWGPERFAAQRTVAVLNRGLPGFNVDVHGRLHLSLMRSCTGWPSGVWLDPPRRTAPDGSSFQLQHWSHRFEHALVAGAGDWREAGLVHAGHGFGDPLHVRPLQGPGGSLPSQGSFLQVEPEHVVLSAMKPAGDPLARMAGVDQDPADGITIRLVESRGVATTVRLRLAWPVLEAHRADLLERPETVLRVDGDTVEFDLDGCEVATVWLRCAAPTEGEVGPSLGWRREPAQPVFGDYWLHNKGAAPIGYQPVTARIRERAVHADGPFVVRLAIASQRTDGPVTGVVDLRVPEGWDVDPPRRTFQLAPGAHEEAEIHVTPPPDATSGRWFVAAHLHDDLGQVHEDVVTVDLGAPPTAGAATEPDVGGPRLLLLERATRKAAVVERPADPRTDVVIGGELTADLEGDGVRLRAGERGHLVVRLANNVLDEIRGEAQLISPWGTWEMTSPWTQGFSVAGGQRARVSFDVSCPRDTPPSKTWALVKVMYFGRLLYTRSVPLVLGGATEESA